MKYILKATAGRNEREINLDYWTKEDFEAFEKKRNITRR